MIVEFREWLATRSSTRFLADAVSLAVDERYRQVHLHRIGRLSGPAVESAGADRDRSITILMEEVGEFAQAYLANDFYHAQEEAVQVAAVALAIVESFLAEQSELEAIDSGG